MWLLQCRAFPKIILRFCNFEIVFSWLWRWDLKFINVVQLNTAFRLRILLVSHVSNGTLIKSIRWLIWCVSGVKCTCNNVVRLPASGPQAQPYSTSLPSSSGGAVSQTHTYRTGSPAGSQSSKVPQPPWSARMPTRGLSAFNSFIVVKPCLKNTACYVFFIVMIINCEYS